MEHRRVHCGGMARTPRRQLNFEPWGVTARRTPVDDLIPDAEHQSQLALADCCCAAWSFRVVLPKSADLQHLAELLFCSHHLRQHWSALKDDSPTIYNRDGHLVSSVDVFGPEKSGALRVIDYSQTR
jgi:hypothetical protein